MSRIPYTIRRLSSSLLLATLGFVSLPLSLHADVPELSQPPTCDADANCLVLEEYQSLELAGIGAIDFVAIHEDSRCPVDVMCFWAGQVLVELRHASGSNAEKFVLGLGQELENVWTDSQTGVALVLEEVWPAPNLSHPIDKPYQIKLRLVEAEDATAPLETH